MKIVITFAVQAEFTLWRRMRGFARIGQTEAPVFLMRSGGAEAYVLITGIGARKFLSEFRNLLATVDICIVSGLAGSLNPRYTRGSVLVAKAIKRDSSDSIITSDESLVKAATECGAVPAGFFYTTGRVVNSASDKSRLAGVADAVDMESFQLMDEAHRHGVSTVAVRALSDSAGENLPVDFNRAIDEAGRIEWLPVLAQVAASPGCLPQLMRFGFESAKSARKLANFLDKYLKCLTGGADLELTGTRMEIR